MDYKVVVVGSSYVGKSCIVNMFTRNTFLTDSYTPTIVDSYRKVVNIDGEDYLLEVIDTAGDEIYRPLTEDELRKGDGFLCVFALNDLDSFEETSTLIKKIYLVQPNTPAIVLIGNKYNKEDRQVEYICGKQQGNCFGIPYLETCAECGYNVKEAFDLVVRMIRRSKDLKESAQENFKTRQCCIIC